MDNGDFSLPEAKRVRREDLNASRSPTPSAPDVDLETAFQKRLAALYGEVPNDASADVPAILDDEDMREADGEAEGFEFRLFATRAATDATTESNGATRHTNRIVLLDQEGALNGDGAFTIPERDPAYYFTGEMSTDQRREFELSAVTGEEVRKWLGIKYPAWSKPWKVTTLKVIGRKAAKGIVDPKVITDQIEAVDPTENTMRKRPGKKRRIILRGRKKKSEESKLRREREAKQKEEAEKEKRTRRNREKKVKRKAKEKAAKAETKGYGGPDDAKFVSGADTVIV